MFELFQPPSGVSRRNFFRLGALVGAALPAFYSPTLMEQGKIVVIR
jgi:hypothetical protein